MLHDLSFVDACCVALSFMEKVYPKQRERIAEYRKLAQMCGIDIEEDPELAAARHREAMAVVEADFGSGDD